MTEATGTRPVAGPTRTFVIGALATIVAVVLLVKAIQPVQPPVLLEPAINIEQVLRVARSTSSHPMTSSVEHSSTSANMAEDAVIAQPSRIPRDHLATSTDSKSASAAIRAAECLINAGRPCDVDETTLFKSSSAAVHEGLFRQYVLDDMRYNFAVQYTSRSQIYNPGIVAWGKRLWMVARHEGRNATGKWTVCPATSLTNGNVLPCPVETFRMLSFVVIAPLSPALEATGPLQCVPYDFRWPDVASKRHERQLGPEDPRPFEWGGEVYVAVNGPPISQMRNQHCVRNMKIQRIFPHVGSAIDLDIAGNILMSATCANKFIPKIKT